MQREAYQVPTLQPGSGGGTTTTTTTAYGISSSGQDSSGGPTTQYLCGDCAAKVHLKKGDPIRCKECGHRVLYKERTKRYVWSGLEVPLLQVLLGKIMVKLEA